MIWLSFLIIFFLITIAALLSATETAITASSPGRMQKLKSEGNKKAGAVLKLLKSKEKVISTLLIGNSIVNTVCTTIATGVFIELLGDDLGTIVSSAVMSFLIIVFGEVIPKAIAVAKAEKIGLFTSSAITFFLRVLRPINYLLEKAVKIFCFIFRINLAQEVSSAEEMRGFIEHQHQEGHVFKYDRDMLGSILDIRDMTISEIMVHRSDMLTIQADLPSEEVVRQALASSYTRIPLWLKDKDNIIGILHIRDLLEALHDQKNDYSKINIKLLLTEPWFIPEHTFVSHQLSEFRQRKSHIAIVVDEYGDLQGMVTLEDILEEIVGQIEDEHDFQSTPIIRRSEKQFIIEGSTTIRDLNRELNWNLPDDDASTIAGLVIHHTKRIPEQGEKLNILGLNITIRKKLGNRIKTLQVDITKAFEEDSAS